MRLSGALLSIDTESDYFIASELVSEPQIWGASVADVTVGKCSSVHRYAAKVK